MRKVQAGISIDLQVWEEVKKIYAGKVSGKVEDYLRRLINYHKSDINGLEIQEMETELQKETMKFNEIVTNIQDLKDRIDLAKQSVEKKEAERIEKEKEEAMKMVTCTHCKVPKHQERMHKTSDDDNLCNGCYMTLDADTLRKYFNTRKEATKDEPADN